MIVSRRNATLKDIRRLRRCKGAHALLEGPHLLAEALATDVPLRSVLASPEFLASEAGRALAERLPQPPLEVAGALLAELCDADAPRGVLAVAELPRPELAALPVSAGGVYVWAERLQDPGNLGALARALEAAGGTALALSPGCAHPNHPRALRGSAGSLLRLPVAPETGFDALLGHLAPAVPRALALVPSGGSPYDTVEAGGTLALALGSEGGGLSEEAVTRCDERVSVPLTGAVESLNVAVAAAVVLFELRRRRP